MSHDNTVKQLLSKVEKQRKELGQKPKFQPLTNCKFLIAGDNYINLHVAGKDDLVRGLAFLYMNQSYYNNAAEVLGFDILPNWAGYSFDDWINDFKARSKSIQWAEDKKNLDAMEKQLKELMSEDGKTAAALESISALLG